jgi:mRNA interferase YafQ
MSRIAQALTNLFDLIGDMGGGYRECHLKPDLLLIYRKVDGAILRLARLCSHSELFG